MNKAELVEAVHKMSRNEFSKVDVECLLNGLTSVIQSQVAQGQEVKLVGFGTFFPRRHRERNGRNPQTGAAIKIDARSAPKFRPGSEFKKLVKYNGKK